MCQRAEEKGQYQAFHHAVQLFDSYFQARVHLIKDFQLVIACCAFIALKYYEKDAMDVSWLDHLCCNRYTLGTYALGTHVSDTCESNNDKFDRYLEMEMDILEHFEFNVCVTTTYEMALLYLKKAETVDPETICENPIIEPLVVAFCNLSTLVASLMVLSRKSIAAACLNLALKMLALDSIHLLDRVFGWRDPEKTKTIEIGILHCYVCDKKIDGDASDIHARHEELLDGFIDRIHFILRQDSPMEIRD